VISTISLPAHFSIYKFSNAHAWKALHLAWKALHLPWKALHLAWKALHLAWTALHVVMLIPKREIAIQKV
jgi:hypothetical protein